MIQLDHMILAVNDVAASLAFYSEILGFQVEASRPPFSTLRVTPDLVLQLAQWGTPGGQHLAFAMSGEEFDAAFGRVKAARIPYGDAFHDVGNMRGPGTEPGARGPGRTLYFFDPSRHLIEIRSYDG